MELDISKIGYRWKGKYAAGTIYTKGDVVSKSGKVQYYTGTVFQLMAEGQLNATVENELLTTGTTQLLTGAAGQSLTVSGSGNIEFQHLEGRSSTAVWKLAHNKFTDTGNTGGTNHFGCIMTDGTVRMWGYSAFYQLGNGSSANRSKPTVVGFPPSAAPMVELYLGRDSSYSLDRDGKLWSWGRNHYGQLGRTSVVTTTQPVAGTPKIVNGYGDLPSDAKVTSVEVGTGYNGYSSVMCQDDTGKVYYWGSNQAQASGDNTGSATAITTPRLVPRSTEINVVKYGCTGLYNQMSYLVDDIGGLWMAGSYLSTGGVATADNPHKHFKWTPSERDPVSHLVMEQSNISFQRRSMIICTNGKIYTWGTAGYSVEVPGSSTGTATEDTRLAGKVVVDAYVSGGGYNQQVVLLDNGEVWGIGYNGQNSLVSVGGTTAWVQLMNGGVGNDIIAIRGGGSNSSKWGMFLTSSGVLKSVGMNTNDGYSANGTILDSTSIPYVREALFNREIIDWRVSGYAVGTGYRQLHILSDDGNVYSCGYNGNAELGRDDDQESASTLSPVLF